MTAINLGIPEGPPPVLAPRRKTRKITLKHHSHPLEIGGDAQFRCNQCVQHLLQM